MALANEILVGRFSGILHKLLNMKEGAPSPQLSPEIMPVIALEMDRPEYDFLGGTRRGAASGSAQSSAAAKYQQMSVVNPVGSGVLAVVDAIVFANTARAVVCDVRLGCAVGAAVAGTSRNTDLRYGSQALACNVFSEEVAALTGVVCYRLRGAQNTTLPVGLTFVLGPGNSVFFTDIGASAGAGEIIQLSAAIRERPLESSETR